VTLILERLRPYTDTRMWRWKVRRNLQPVGLVFGLLILFEALVRAGLIDPHHLPPPSEIFTALTGRLQDASLVSDVAQTLEGWGAGLAIACAIALPLGIPIGRSALVYRLVRGPMELLRPIPSVAFVPVVVLTLGSGLEAKIFLVAFAAFWPLLIHTIYGMRDFDPQLMETARSLGMGPGARLGRVVIPGALPYMATGLRIASSLALILAITTELVIGSPGLGQSISLAQAGGAIPNMYALIVVAGLLGWALNSALVSIEQRLLRWHVTYRESGA
jgi:ABC-type nitrate/sulfonate/bicarbonate transport system permease component